MNTDLLKALIGGVAAIIGAVASVLIKSYLENRNFRPIATNRKIALSGTWRGRVDQTVSDTQAKTYQLDLTITVNRKKINGEGVINLQGQFQPLVLDGAFRNDSFLKVEYQNKNNNIVQFGAMVLKLSADCTKLKGRYVGYGHISEAIVYGDVEFIKDSV